MADIKISELEPTTDLQGLYTIGSDKNNLSKKVSLQFIADVADYAKEQGDYAKNVGGSLSGKITELSYAVEKVENDLSLASGKVGELEERRATGTGVYVTTLSVTAGVSHSSTKDRIPCSIKQGESFYAFIRKRNGAELTQVSINVPAVGYDSWKTIGNVKAYNPPTLWTAPYEIAEIGYFIEGAHITNNGEIDIVIYTTCKS